jgi:ABC-2 type transport system ATP-binding protein
MVTARQLTKRWGDHDVLVNASFEIEHGVTGLLGANGAGKTTIFGMLLGLHAPNSGELRVLDLDPRTSGPLIRQRMGYSPEHEALPSDMSAYDFVRHVAELHGLPRRAAAGRASDALYEVGLGEERARACGTMSTGQKQRVKLAQAIVHDPQLVLLDEPTNGLDPVQRDEMLKLIRRCGHELGLSVVLSSHLLDEIERTCDRVTIVANHVVTNGGELAHSSSPNDAPLAVELDTDAATAELFAASLRGKGFAAHIDPAHRFTVVVTSEFDQRRISQSVNAERDQHEATAYELDAVRDQLIELNIGVRSMKRQTRSLEDVFFEATA